MEFIAGEFDRWTCGPFVIARYYDGFYAYRYFKYLHGGRCDAKRLHPEDRPRVMRPFRGPGCGVTLRRARCRPAPGYRHSPTRPVSE